jgi:hypothetical protein
VCHAELCDVTTTKISMGQPKIEYVDPLPDIQGTVAVTSTSNGYAGNVVAEKSKRSAMQLAGIKALHRARRSVRQTRRIAPPIMKGKQ